MSRATHGYMYACIRMTVHHARARLLRQTGSAQVVGVGSHSSQMPNAPGLVIFSLVDVDGARNILVRYWHAESSPRVLGERLDVFLCANRTSTFTRLSALWAKQTVQCDNPPEVVTTEDALGREYAYAYVVEHDPAEKQTTVRVNERVFTSKEFRMFLDSDSPDPGDTVSVARILRGEPKIRNPIRHTKRNSSAPPSLLRKSRPRLKHSGHVLKRQRAKFFSPTPSLTDPKERLAALARLCFSMRGTIQSLHNDLHVLQSEVKRQRYALTRSEE